MLLELEKLGKEITLLGETFTRSTTFDKHLERVVQKGEKMGKEYTEEKKLWSLQRVCMCFPNRKILFSLMSQKFFNLMHINSFELHETQLLFISIYEL